MLDFSTPYPQLVQEESHEGFIQLPIAFAQEFAVVRTHVENNDLFLCAGEFDVNAQGIHLIE